MMTTPLCRLLMMPLLNDTVPPEADGLLDNVAGGVVDPRQTIIDLALFMEILVHIPETHPQRP
jgi:hypothetical protein